MCPITHTLSLSLSVMLFSPCPWKNRPADGAFGRRSLSSGASVHALALCTPHPFITMYKVR